MIADPSSIVQAGGTEMPVRIRPLEQTPSRSGSVGHFECVGQGDSGSPFNGKIMEQEEKQLLLKDLCSRLPYGVKFQGEDSNVYTLDAANYFALQVEDVVFKPYLRPMSSMTPDERFEYDELRHFYTHGLDFNVDEVDWLNAHHFDYRGLIPMGLALEAPEGMYEI